MCCMLGCAGLCKVVSHAEPPWSLCMRQELCPDGSDHECQPSLHSAVVDEQLGAIYGEIHLEGERLGALLLPVAVHRRDGDSFHRD